MPPFSAILSCRTPGNPRRGTGPAFALLFSRQQKKGHPMKYRMFAVALGMMAAAAMLAGCDDEIAREEQVEVRDDGTVVREETVVRERNGTIIREETREIDRPGTR
jgi:hypothetical protein